MGATKRRLANYRPQATELKGGHSQEYVELREGNYYVSGTRVSLDSLIHGFRRGESPETIRQNFEVLHLEEVFGAIAHYLANQTEFDAYLAGQAKKWREGRCASEGLPPALSRKLERARNDLSLSRLP
jgi:uncharacterized protein (DUF433 family)